MLHFLAYVFFGIGPLSMITNITQATIPTVHVLMFLVHFFTPFDLSIGSPTPDTEVTCTRYVGDSVYRTISNMPTGRNRERVISLIGISHI